MASILIWGRARDILAGELPPGVSASEVRTLPELNAQLDTSGGTLVLIDPAELEKHGAALDAWLKSGGAQKALFVGVVDGAGRLRILLGVVLPLTAPGVVSAALLVFLMSWNEFLFAFTFTATEASRTVPVALALFPGIFEVPWGDIAAASMLAGRRQRS